MSEALKHHLIKKLEKAGGSIPFTEYMQEVLYAPNFGYYTTNENLFEKASDFTTAPELSPLFAQTLARVCSALLKDFSRGIIVELGAGSGKMALELIKAMDKLNTPPSAYWIVDPSPVLRKKQRTLIEKHLPDWLPKCRWFSELPKENFCGIILANEVLDAMPVQRFTIYDHEVFEVYTTFKSERFDDVLKPASDPDLQKLAGFIIQQGADLTRPYHSERNPGLSTLFQQLSTLLEKGAAFFLDYGFPQHEYYHPDRFMGTLMCHHQHQAHTDPYQHIGRQDITAHVDFSDAALQAEKAGFHIAGYTTQAAFLLNAGLAEIAGTLENPLVRRMLVQPLTSPAEMGELFKVLALTKSLDESAILGFELFDKRHRL